MCGEILNKLYEQEKYIFAFIKTYTLLFFCYSFSEEYIELSVKLSRCINIGVEFLLFFIFVYHFLNTFLL